jgi:hypothetical protein
MERLQQRKEPKKQQEFEIRITHKETIIETKDVDAIEKEEIPEKIKKLS